MTQGSNKSPLLLTVDVEETAAHASRIMNKDHRPVTYTRRGLFPRLKWTSRPTLLTGTTQLPSLTD